MSSSAIVATQTLIAQNILLYGGSIILILGVLGGCFNTIVLISLRTFRENSSAYYLLIMSIVNIGQLLTGLSSRITISGFAIDWTQMSLFYCKFRYFIFQFSTLLSFSSLCLATIDQYFATCSNPRWQRWSNIKHSHRFIGLFTAAWILHGIPFLIFYNHATLPTTGIIFCTSVNIIFLKYYSYGFLLILNGILPVSLTGIFGLLAYQNVRTIAYRTVPLVRRELDKQLTVMVLTQVICNCFLIIPFSIVNTIAFHISSTTDQNIIATIQLIGAITVCLYYSFFAVKVFFFYFSFTLAFVYL